MLPAFVHIERGFSFNEREVWDTQFEQNKDTFAQSLAINVERTALVAFHQRSPDRKNAPFVFTACCNLMRCTELRITMRMLPIDTLSLEPFCTWFEMAAPAPLLDENQGQNDATSRTGYFFERMQTVCQLAAQHLTERFKNSNSTSQFKLRAVAANATLSICFEGKIPAEAYTAQQKMLGQAVVVFVMATYFAWGVLRSGIA